MTDELDDRIDQLLALAALGELTPAEEIELDAALAADVDVAAELAADLDVAAQIQSTLATPPPASMKANVMAAIDALDAETGTNSETATDTGTVVPIDVPAAPAGDVPATEPVAAPTSTTETSAPAGVSDLGAARAKRNRGWQPLAAAAAVAMLVVGGLFITGRSGNDGATFDAVAEADDAQQRTLEGELGGTLDVVYSPSEDAFVLVGSGIPTLIDAETYQLWFVDDDGAESVGLFRPDDSGRVEQVFDGLDPTDVVVGVTVEPAAGSDAPTLPIVAAA